MAMIIAAMEGIITGSTGIACTVQRAATMGRIIYGL
jgi:hypothetical protein